MSITIDSVNQQAYITGAPNQTQGGYSADLEAAPSGAVGMQIAYRAYFDSFSYAGPVSGYSRSGITPTVYSASATWDCTTSFGLSFDETFPFRDPAGIHHRSVQPGFVGFQTGVSINTCPMSVTSLTIGNVDEWCHFGESATDVNHTNQRRSGSSNTTESYVASALTSSASNQTWIKAFPCNPTDGAKVTIGIDFRRSHSTNYGVVRRIYINTSSLSEANMMNVFASHDLAINPLVMNLSTSSINSEDAWISDAGAMLFPRRFMFRCGLPSQTLVLKHFKYRYLIG